MIAKPSDFKTMNPKPDLIKPVRLILVDAHGIQPGGLASDLSATSLLQLVGQASDEEEALQLCYLTHPEVALVNLETPGMDSLAVVSGLSVRWPEMTVLALVANEKEEVLRAALEAGAAGYVLHDASPTAVTGVIIHLLETRRSNAGAVQNAYSLSQTLPERATGPSSQRTGELAEAARIQNSLLPAAAPTIPGWDLAVKLLPARETSGDFYDFIALPNDRLGIIIADVSDKGLGAALFMAMTSTLFRTYTSQHNSLPALVMSLVNERMISDSGGSSFVTAFLGILEPTTGRLRYVNAGHIPPVMLSSLKGKSIDRLARTGMALGVLKDTAWQQKLAKLVPGDTLLLFTDGIMDAQNSRGDYYGEQRLLRVARANSTASATAFQDAVLADLLEFTGNTPQADDILLIVLKRCS
jgi:serine phosphatase RsbU (regulator of sigma subunit)